MFSTDSMQMSMSEGHIFRIPAFSLLNPKTVFSDAEYIVNQLMYEYFKSDYPYYVNTSIVQF